MRMNEHSKFYMFGKAFTVGTIAFISLYDAPSSQAATKGFMGTASFPYEHYWTRSDNWYLPGTPGSNDDVIIGVSPYLVPASVINGGGTIQSLTLAGSSSLSAGNLTVTNLTSIDNATYSNSSNSTLTTGQLSLTNGGLLHLSSGELHIGSTATIDQNSTLDTYSGTIFLDSGASSFVNNGIFEVKGDAVLGADSGSFDLGGTSGGGEVIISYSDSLTHNALMTSGTFDGTLTMQNESTFYYPLSWTATGTISLDDAEIQGGTLTLSSYADLDIVDNSTIQSNLVVDGIVTIDTAETSDSLTLEGVTTYNSGTMDVGDLYLENNATFNGGSVTIHDLSIASQSVTSFNTGVTMNVGYDTYVAGTMNVNRTSFTGSELDDLEIASSGEVNLRTNHVDGVVVGGRVHLAGSLNALEISSATPTILDIDGVLTFESSSASVVASELYANGVYVNLNVENELDMGLHLPAHTSGSPGVGIRLYGNAILELNEASTIFRYNNPLLASGSELVINDSLAIGKYISFSGLGTIAIASGATVEVNGDGVDLAVYVDNDGILDIVGSDARTLTIGSSTDSRSYTQGSTGTLKITIADSDDDVDNYDDVDIYGDVDLDGELAIDLGSFTPSTSDPDVYEVLTWTGTLTGEFASASGLISADDSAMLELVYNTYSLELVTWLAGDMDHDGYVGLDDLDLVLANWNTTVGVTNHAQGDASGDGIVGLADMDAVLNNWNAGTPPTAEVSLIPEPTSLALLSLGGLAMLRRGKH